MPSDVNSAQVVIKRERSWSGALLVWSVLVDGQKAGTLPNGGSLTVETEPGHHTIVVGPPGISGPSSEPFAFEAQPGARVDLVTQATSWRPKIWRPGMAPRRSGLADFLDRAAGASARWSQDKSGNAPGRPSAPGEPPATHRPARHLSDCPCP